MIDELDVELINEQFADRAAFNRRLAETPLPEYRAAEIVSIPRQRLGVRMSTVQRERVEWLWDHRIPLGKLCLIDGDPGLGKSLISVDLAARITRGRRMPDGSPGFEGDVVMMSAEDGLGDTIRPRLELAGANLERVTSLATLPTPDGQERVAVIPDDLPHLITVVQETSAALVIIDPLTAFLSSKINAHRDQDVRRALAPLALAANKHRFAVVIIRHLNKSTTTSNPLYRGGGSIGIAGAARSAMVVGEDPDNKERRILAPTKSNLGPPTRSLAYRIEAIDDTPRIVWDGTSDHTAEALLTQSSTEQRSQRATAKDFLREVLADGPVDSAKVYSQAENLDLKRNTICTLRRSSESEPARQVSPPGGLGSCPKICTKPDRIMGRFVRFSTEDSTKDTKIRSSQIRLSL